jgi:oxygen-independent coproporphyrinogen-3 oxidase
VIPTRPSRPGGIYVHYPFCDHHCFYCDFNVAVPRSIPQRAYTDAVLAELRARAPDLKGAARSLYFGGGTPSLWPAALVSEVIAEAKRGPGLREDAEITLEANPAQLTVDWLAAMAEVGITRLSLGVQALHDDLLGAIDRRHDGVTAQAAISRALGAGFQSISVDFMFGLPGQAPDRWAEDLATIAHMGVPHLSMYNLTVEPRTGLYKEVREGRVQLPSEGAQLEMLLTARAVLTAAGFKHYEVSSYARPGHQAVHNAGYWELRPYLGIGAGAHGFIGDLRWSNLRRFNPYMEAAQATGRPAAQQERLTPTLLAYERVMTGLRRLDQGVDVGDDWPLFEAAIGRQTASGRLELTGSRIRLTDDGLRLMNSVLLDLLPDDA